MGLVDVRLGMHGSSDVVSFDRASRYTVILVDKFCIYCSSVFQSNQIRNAGCVDISAVKL